MKNIAKVENFGEIFVKNTKLQQILAEIIQSDSVFGKIIKY